MLLNTWGAGLLGNMLAGKGNIRTNRSGRDRRPHPLTNFVKNVLIKTNLNSMVFIQEILYIN